MHELLKLMQLSTIERALLLQLRPLAVEASPSMSKDFYERLLAHEHTREYLKDFAIEGLHSTIRQWFQDLFSGKYDEEYARKRLIIGHIHVRIGLPVRYPLAMIDVIAHHGEQITRRSSHPEQALVAFRKILALDIAIFNQAYEDNQLQHLAELVGGERLARLLLTGYD